MLVLDFATTGLSPSPRSSVCSGSGILALSFAHLGFLMPSKSYTRPGSPASIPGIACTGFVFTLLVTEAAHLDLFLPLRSLAQSGFAALVLGFAHISFLLLIQSYSRLTSSVLLLGRQFVDFLSVLDFSSVELSAPLHSFARSDPVPLIPGSAHTGFSIPTRQSVCSGFLLLLLGASRFQSTDKLSVLGRFVVEPPMLPHSFARTDFVLLACQLANIDFLLLLQSIL